MLNPHGERAKQAHEEAGRWGRTWDPSGARRPRGLAWGGSGAALAVLLVVAALVAWWLS